MRRLALVFIMMILTSSASMGQEETVETNNKEKEEPKASIEGTEEKEEPKDSTEEKEKWEPPPPDPDDFDWIRLTNGEWLKGDITVLRRDSLEFDSDEMDNQKFDWEDIAEVRSPRINSYLFDPLVEGGEDVEVIGTLLVRGDYVLIRDMEGAEHRFPRARLRTIIPGEPKELNYWSGNVGFGFTSRSGNTDQTEYTGSVNILRRTLDSRFSFDYVGSYGKLEGEQNVNNHRIYTKFDYFMTQRFYWTILGVEAYRDPFQNIDHRLTPATGAGYFIFDEGDLEWEAGGLFGWQYTKYDSVATGEDDSDSTGAVIAYSNYEMEVTSDVDFNLDYRVAFISSDLGEANHHAETGLSVDLGSNLDLNVMFVWDRVGDPQRDSSGELPEKNDYRFTVGLELEF